MREINLFESLCLYRNLAACQLFSFNVLCVEHRQASLLLYSSFSCLSAHVPFCRFLRQRRIRYLAFYFYFYFYFILKAPYFVSDGILKRKLGQLQSCPCVCFDIALQVICCISKHSEVVSVVGEGEADF